MIRIVLADDERIVREGVRKVLEHMGGLEVVAEAEDGEQAVRAIERSLPDLAVLDVRMPRAGGIEALRTLRERGVGTPVVLLTTFDDPDEYAAAVRAGANGWHLKADDPEELAATIRAAAAGAPRFVPAVGERAPASEAPAEVCFVEELTQREGQIARLIARGMRNRDIAVCLGTAEGTVKNHVSAILRKVGARNRTAAIVVLSRLCRI